MQKRISKKVRLNRQLKERQLISQNQSLYNKLKAVGYTHQQAIAKIKTTTSNTSLEKLKKMYQKNVKQPGVVGISMQGIRRTKEVENFIKQKQLIDRGYVLFFLPDKKLERSDMRNL